MNEGIKSVEIRIPTFTELLSGVPEELQTPELRSALLAAYQSELSAMVCHALTSDCLLPRIVMKPWRQTERQHILEFVVSDLHVDVNPNSVNFHGQNTSQWRYAGAIVVEGNCVSRHH